MSEGKPQEQRDNPELSRLIEELERQIEGVNQGLSKIRGTVARISFAAFGSATPTSTSSAPHDHVGAPANRNEWRPQEVSEPVSAPEPPLATQPSPRFSADTVPPSLSEEPAEEAESGFWTSVEEGASWPRSHADEKLVPEVEHEAKTESRFEAEAPPPAEPHPTNRLGWPEAAADEAGDVASDGIEGTSDAWAVEGAPTEVNALKSVESEGKAPDSGLDPSHDISWSFTAEPERDEMPPAPGEVSKSPPKVEGASGQMPAILSAGWPDESAWSQSYEWKTNEGRASEDDARNDVAKNESVNVSDIVAQVRAELEAARRGDGPMPSFESPPGDADEGWGATAQEASTGEPADPPASDVDDIARRDEVSRAVAEMRQKIEAGEFEDVMRGRGVGPAQVFDSQRGENQEPQHGESDGGEHAALVAGWGEPESESEPMSEEEMRAEVRRAVEATRDELSEEDQKPAFRLAAPGALPDWSHMQVEPSGPPVVVLKDADGRVELASVYETLNELGCGDGAALLNYTPHSVTVGLPASASFPSKERVAQAVEKVFGLSSRIESDGVRLTVSIGAEPKRRSVDAA